MKHIKVTPRCRKVLDLLIGGAIAHYMPYMGRFRPNPYWFIDGLRDKTNKCTREMRVLLRHKLAVEINDRGYGSSNGKAAPDIADKIANVLTTAPCCKG